MSEKSIEQFCTHHFFLKEPHSADKIFCIE